MLQRLPFLCQVFDVWKALLISVIQIALRNRRNLAPSKGISDGRNLIMSDFDHSDLFQSKKQHSVNIENWLKSKLAWPVCTKSMNLKIGIEAMTADKIESFYWLITWKLLFSESVYMICIDDFLLLQNKESINILQLYITSWCLLSVEKKVTFQKI